MRVDITNYKSIAYKQLGKFEDTRFEKIHNVIFESSQEASILVAQEIASLIREKEKANKLCVLGLATGSSPIKVYEELVRMHKEDGNMLTAKKYNDLGLADYAAIEAFKRYHF